MTGRPSIGERASFAGFELDLRSGELRKPDGGRAILAEQPFRTLAILLSARGALVTREALQRELWADDTFVDFEHGLNAAVKRVREAIGDSATAPRFIETIPRRGYRFIAPVEIVAPVARPSVARHRRAWFAVAAAVAVAVAVWFGANAKSHATAPLTGRLVRLTTDPGLTIDPALSADGRLVAYASDRQSDSGLDIWIQPVAGGAPRRLTSDEGDETEPSFSPDGALVAYAAREKGGIFVVRADGGAPRLVAPANRARTPRFSPDGKWIAYWTGVPLWSEVQGGIDASGALAIVAPSGGSAHLLTTNTVSARYPVWSPASDRLLFIGDRVASGEHHVDWFTIARGGGDAVETGAVAALRTAGVTGVPIPGGWTADGLVVSSVIGDDANVWAVPVSPSTGKVSGTPRRLTFGSGHEESPATSASGAMIAFASVTQNVDAWRIALDPHTGVGRGDAQRVTADAAADRVMNLTADGARLAFVSTRTGQPELWMREIARGIDTRITSGGSVDGARISRDGAWIAVNKAAPGRSTDLMPSAGGPPRHLCDDCLVDDFSPDGTRMLLGRGNPMRIVMRDVASSRETELASHPTWNLFQARFSPDGEWVVFQTTNAPAVRQIYVVPARSTAVPAEQWISIVTDFGIQPSWATDGRGIYYFSFRDGSFCAWLQRLDPATHRPAGPPFAVAHLHHPRLRAVEGAVVTNDVASGFLYATLTEMSGNIWLLRPGDTTRR